MEPPPSAKTFSVPQSVRKESVKVDPDGATRQCGAATEVGSHPVPRAFIRCHEASDPAGAPWPAARGRQRGSPYPVAACSALKTSGPMAKGPPKTYPWVPEDSEAR